jgi:hypothetical protein
MDRPNLMRQGFEIPCVAGEQRAERQASPGRRLGCKLEAPVVGVERPSRSRLVDGQVGFVPTTEERLPDAAWPVTLGQNGAVVPCHPT